MRPTFMGFEAARRGLAVNQKGLDVVGHNLANVYTEGYTRQRVDTYSIGSNMGASRFAGPNTDHAGQGVRAGGVSQTRDAFLDKRFRDEYADVGYYGQVSTILQDIQASICDPETYTNTGIKTSINAINKALEEFTENSDSKVHANVVATEFKNLTLLLHQFDSKLNNIAEQQKGDLNIATKNVNEVLSKLSAINKTISEDANARASDSEYYGPNELMDERNLLLDELAQYGNINVKSKEDGSVSVTMDGRTILDGEKFDSLNFRENSDGTVALNWNSDGKALQSATGALKGSLDMINGRGPYAQNTNESSAKGVLYYKDKMNMLANTLTSTFNNILPECDDATGNPKVDGSGNIIYKQLLGARTLQADGSVDVMGGVPTTAANISISEEWANDSSYLIFRPGTTNSKYAQMMTTAIDKGTHSFQFMGTTTKATFRDFVDGYVGECGSETKFNLGRSEATSAIASDTLDRRDEVSAVAPDEETTNMMLYNKSFQAISRLMTSLDEALDILINRTGMVGR